MAAETLALIENKTQKEVLQPDNINLVLIKWVYAIKTNVDGSIKRFKARLVARGFTQVYRQDYTKTFAPTARIDTLRILLATVAAKDLECLYFDIKNAFTESHLAEKIYLKPPKGIEVKKGHVL